MKKILFAFSFLLFFNPIKSQITYTTAIISSSQTNSITCAVPVITLTAVSNFTGASLNYTWYSNSGLTIGATNLITIPGIYTLVAGNGINSFSTRTIAILSNTLAPVVTISPTLQAISCSVSTAANFVNTVVSPLSNFLQKVTSPYGGMYYSTQQSFTYAARATGLYTNEVKEVVNGCITIKTFSVSSNSSFPTMNLISPQNFTLGCSTKSVAIINYANPQSGGGAPISFSLLSQSTSSQTGSGVLSSQSNYTINTAGNYTAVLKDNVSLCESRVPFTVLYNLSGPTIDSVRITSQTLTCANPQTTITTISNNPFVNYTWQSGSLNQSGNTFVVQTNTATPNATIIATPSCTLIDSDNLCKTTTVIPIYQNIFAPTASIGINSTTTGPSITCTNPYVILVNTSISNVPSVFGFGLAIGQLWTGPAPSPSLSISSTYSAAIAGIYTLNVSDSNNKCTSQAIILVNDARVLPNVTQSSNIYTIACPIGSVVIEPTVNGSLNSYTYAWQTLPGASITGGLNSYSIGVASAGNYTLLVTNPTNSCSTSLVYAVWACTGLKDETNSNQLFNYYPNPNNGIFTIENINEQKISELNIYNLLGECVLKFELKQGKNLINIEQMEKGMYEARISSKDLNQLQSFKIINR